MYKKVQKLHLSATFGKLPLNERNNHENKLFCSRKYLYSPHGRFSDLDPHPPWKF